MARKSLLSDEKRMELMNMQAIIKYNGWRMAE